MNLFWQVIILITAKMEIDCIDEREDKSNAYDDVNNRKCLTKIGLWCKVAKANGSQGDDRKV